jgi:hypothetical protein
MKHKRLEPDWRGIAEAIALAAGELAVVGKLIGTTGKVAPLADDLKDAVESTRDALDKWLAAEKGAREGVLPDAELVRLNDWFKTTHPSPRGAK